MTFKKFLYVSTALMSLLSASAGYGMNDEGSDDEATGLLNSDCYCTQAS